MSATQLSALALEYWRASGPRTLARLAYLVDFVVSSQHGPAPWQPEIDALAFEARDVARAAVRSWEVAQ